MNHYFMVDADSHLKLLPPTLLDICKVFEHNDMMSIDTLIGDSNNFIHSTRLRIWDSGSFVESK
jgi:hypothetical protein